MRLVQLSDLPGDPRELLAARLEDIQRRIAAAARRAGRSGDAVRLVAVTKYVDVELVRLLHGLGLRDFGESRVQDLLRKRQALADLEETRFHLVGHLQRNKVQKALEACAAIHSLDSIRLLEEIEGRASKSGAPVPDLWVEVNVAGERQKTGLPPEDLEPLLQRARTADLLRPAIRGLMAMAPLAGDLEAARAAFRRLRELRDAMLERGLLGADGGLSMGMSGDFEVAIEEGATVVRVGSALYTEE